MPTGETVHLLHPTQKLIVIVPAGSLALLLVRLGYRKLSEPESNALLATETYEIERKDETNATSNP